MGIDRAQPFNAVLTFPRSYCFLTKKVAKLGKKIVYEITTNNGNGIIKRMVRNRPVKFIKWH